jgi:hypothetical protein
VISIVEEYVGSSCFEEGSGGGGGAGGGPPDEDPNEEYAAKRSVMWVVALSPPWAATGEIKSMELIKGKRVASEPQGGHFVWLQHMDDACTYCSFGGEGSSFYRESFNGTASGQSAGAEISGTVYYLGLTNIVSGSKSWTFQELFP